MKPIKNIKYIIVIIILVFTYAVNKGVFTGEKISSDDCQNGKCTKDKSMPNLDDKNPFYYADDAMKDDGEGYYRVSYRVRSDKDSKLKMTIASYADKDQQVGDFEVAASDDYQNKEAVFHSSGEYPNVVFEKENHSDGASIFIDGIKISKLAITNDQELAALKPTIFGDVDTSIEDQKQTSDSSTDFTWLRSPKTVIGQVFKAQNDYISGVSLKVDIFKDIDPGSREYALTLKEASYDGNSVSQKGQVISQVKFSIGKDIDLFRQDDGTFRFPIYGKLQKDKYYMIALDNSKVDVSDTSYLTLKGSSRNDSYADGSAVIRKGKDFYKIDGDLYFVTYGADFAEYDGERFLSGSSIEDSGKGQGEYAFAARGEFADILDLYSSSGVNFDALRKAVVGDTDDDNNYEYRFHVGKPISRITFEGEQLRAGWTNAKVFYSFDDSNWQEIPSEEISEVVDQADQGDGSDSNNDNSESDGSGDGTGSVTEDVKIQKFDFSKEVDSASTDVYLKVTYEKGGFQGSKYFGLKNVKFTADFK